MTVNGVAATDEKLQGVYQAWKDMVGNTRLIRFHFTVVNDGEKYRVNFDTSEELSRFLKAIATVV